MESIIKHNIYFLGIGGIGMSALARHFNNKGYNVCGYDKVPTPLTRELMVEGISIHFDDDIKNIPEAFKQKQQVVVIYTPAIPAGHVEWNYFKQNGFEIIKRSEALGLLTNPYQSIAVSGTHGKTSTSTIAAYLLQNSKVGCSAFLGGISKNFESNYIFSDKSPYVVVEADEYDRSFLRLHPYIAIVTAVDPDHLEIYGDKNSILNSFNDFLAQVNKQGLAIINKKVVDELTLPKDLKIVTYDLSDSSADYYVSVKKLQNGLYIINLHTPEGEIENMELGIPGEVNVENAVAAIAASLNAGVSAEEIKTLLPGLKGVKRRLDILFRSDRFTYIDDYAHHPEEIKRLATSLKEMYPGKHISAVFQPHLYSRTRDFLEGFAESLSLFDSLYLLDIYPARELPIAGVTSQIIYDRLSVNEKFMVSKENVVEKLDVENTDVLVTVGAGDIDTLREPIVELAKMKMN